MFSGVGKQMVNAEFSRIYRFVKLLVNEGFLAVYISSTDVTQLSLTLKMTTAQVLETSVTDTPRYSLCSVRKNVKVY